MSTLPPQVKQGRRATAFQKAAKGPTPNSFSKTSSLGAPTAAVAFLESMRLFYCTNCEER